MSRAPRPPKTRSTFTFLLTSVLLTLSMIHRSSGQSIPCDDTSGCYPVIFDITQGMSAHAMRTLEVSTTCEVTDTTGQYMSLDNSDFTTYTCTAPGTVAAGNMVDEDNGVRSYWQSGNMIATAGASPEPLYVVFNFTDVFSLHLIEVKFNALHYASTDNTANAKPDAWTIEKWDSNTDQWAPLRHFALDCASSFPGFPLYDDFVTPADVREVNCQEYLPVEDPYFDLDNWVEFYPGTYDVHGDQYKVDPAVLEHYSSSAVRFNIVSPPNQLPLKSYVAISDVNIDVQALCSGHSNATTGPNSADCVCYHNTMGPQCTQCMPLFNNQTWTTGLPGDANVCQECMCNGQADSCTYDAVKDHGLCQACRNEASGDFCESCVSGFFQNLNVSSYTTTVPPGQAVNALAEGDFCLPCDCFHAGTDPASLDTCDPVTGQCTCKAYVTARDCSECSDTFYNLQSASATGCQACNCEQDGCIGNINLCDKYTGQCLCKANVVGERCDTCKDLTFLFSASNPDGCTACDCDPGASLSQACSVTSGQCNCRHNTLTGRDCRTPASGYYVPRLDMLVIEPETDGVLTGTDGSPLDIGLSTVLRAGHGSVNATVSGRGLVLLTPTDQLQMTLTSPYSGAINIVVRFERTGSDNFVYLTGSLTLTSAGEYICGSVTFTSGNRWNLLYSNVQTAERGGVLVGQACAQQDSVYSLTLTNPGTDLLIDSVVIMPDTSHVIDSLTAALTLEEVNRCVTLAETDVRSNRGDCASTDYSIMAATVGQAWRCACSGGAVTSATCDPYSGDCSCKTGSLLPDCTVCRVDSYAFSTTYGCLACGCYEAGSESVHCNEQGECACLPNVSGVKCDACDPDHFGLTSGQGCSQCQCNLAYSVNNACDDSGQCTCKPGVSGLVCDACMNGFYNLTSEGCTECACNHLGSTNRSCDVTTGVCECLARVEGDTCDTCKPGYYGLGTWNPDGCVDCFCWGRALTCQSAVGWSQAEASSYWPLSDPNTPFDLWTAVDVELAPVPVTTPSIVTSRGSQYVMRILSSVPSNPAALTDQYFVANDRFHGDLSPSYGRRLLVTLRPRDSNYQLPTTVNVTGDFRDALLSGDYVTFLLGMELRPYTNGASGNTYMVSMVEGSFRKFDLFNRQVHGGEVTYAEFVQLLTQVTGLYIRGFRRETPDVIYDLEIVTLETAEDTGGLGTPTNNVGQCNCDLGYAGRLCEVCAAGYTRADPNNTRPDSECVPCTCNNHGVRSIACDPVSGVCSSEVTGPCDPVTGVCTCGHSTAGDSCEVCLEGYYGDATRGTEDDCLPCLCPGSIPAGDVNVFATNCTADPNGLPLCVGCMDGYTGDQCQLCADGFFGTPENVTNNDGQCQACVCNGRAATCDNVTGQCTSCADNTGGLECEVCGEGFYGNPAIAPCQPCPCSGQVGGTGLCDPSSGVCVCLPYVIGAACDTCEPGAYTLVEGVGCTPCECNMNGSTSATCDTTTGQCQCVQRVRGRQCDQCIDNYYNVNQITGCDTCSCNIQGTAQENGVTIQACDVITGQCTCALPGITGRTCDSCSPVSTYTYDYVSLFQIGTFPNCELCGECFDSWAFALDDIGHELNLLDQSLVTVWSHYGDKTAAEVGPIITGIEQTINQTQTSMDNIEVIAAQIQDLSLQIAQTSERDRAVSSRTALFSETERSLSLVLDTVTSLTDAVQVTGGVVTSLTSLQGQLDMLEAQASASYNEGSRLWESIQSLSFVVADPAERERQISQQAQRYMVTAAIAEDTYNLVDLLYNTTLTPGVLDNDRELTLISGMVANVTAALADITQITASVLTDATSTQSTVTAMLDSAQTSQAAMLALVESSQEVLANASAVRKDAIDTATEAADYQVTTDTAQDTLTLSLISLLTDIASLTQTQTDMVSAQVQSTQVTSTQLRSVSELEAILTQIAASDVSTERVREVNEEAQSALFEAEDALADTQQALQVSRELNQEIDLMAADNGQSIELRIQAEGIRIATDGINTTVYDVLARADTVSSTSENHITTLSAEATSLSTNISQASADLTTATLDVNNALISSQQADQRADTAVDAQQTLLATMAVVNTELDEAGTVATLSTMTNADNEMTDLITDFSDVQNLVDMAEMIQVLTNQQAEMVALEAEVDQLLAQANDLAVRLQQGSGTTCANP